MIEREFIRQKAKHLKIKEFVENKISKTAGAGKVVIEKTPMGEKILIIAVRPGLIIGRGGKTISELTEILKKKFKLENPQIEVQEVENPHLNATIVARKIAADLERFGAKRYKVIGYRALQNVLGSKAIGAEIRITGRGIPGQKARSWRFYGGYMKKCGNVAVTGVDYAQSRANLRSGTVGIKVKIMPPDIELPDRIKVKEIFVEEAPVEKEVKSEPKEAPKPKKTQSKRKRLAEPSSEAALEPAKKKVAKKKPAEKKPEPKKPVEKVPTAAELAKPNLNAVQMGPEKPKKVFLGKKEAKK